MTKPTISAVATLSGRELDAAISAYVFGNERTYDWLKSISPFADVPQYTHANGRLLVAMIDRARETGWAIQIDQWVGIGEASVDLVPTIDGEQADLPCVRGIAADLPTAFGRALLMTAYPIDELRKLS